MLTMAEDWAHLGTLTTMIRRQRDIADDVHAVTARLIRTPGKPRGLLQRLSSEVRQLAGLFHSLDLLVASLGDADTRFPQGYNLYHFAHCEHTLTTLQHFLQVRGSAGGPSETNLRQDLEGFIKRLNGHRINLEYASRATSVASLLAVVTQRSSTESRTSREYRDRRWFSKIDHASQQYLEDRVFSAFRSVEPTTHLRYHLILMCPGTYDWIQEEAFFTAWEDGIKPKLLISGPPGAGKTTLASSIIQRLSHEPDSDAICFSFVGEETPKPTVASIIGALISHVAMSNRTAFDSLENHFRTVVPDQSLSYLGTNPRSLSDLFKSLIRPLKKVFIVVDGIEDVLADIGLLIELVASWTVDHPGVRTLLISRSSPIVVGLCEETGFAAVDFEPRPVDIDEFVKYRLAQVSGGSSVGSEVARSIHSALSQRPQSFRYVECQLDHLLSLPSDEARQIELADLPKTLDESYMRNFQQTSRIVRLGLAWIRHADERRLGNPQSCCPNMPGFGWTELCQALSVFESSDTTSLAEVTPINEEAVRRELGSLVRSGLPDEYGPSKGDRTLALGHKTVLEFLESKGITSDPERTPDGSISEPWIHEDADTLLLHTLLKMLSMRDFDRPLENSKEADHIYGLLKNWPLHRFASAHWPMIFTTHDNGPMILAMARRLFRGEDLQSSNLLLWMAQYCLSHFPAAFGPDDSPRTTVGLCQKYLDRGWTTCTPLGVAAALGLPALCQSLMVEDDGRPSTSAGLGIRSPLYMAMLGPQALCIEVQGSEPQAATDYSLIWERLHKQPLSAERRETILKLTGYSSAILLGRSLSLTAPALLSCAFLDDIDLFRVFVHDLQDASRDAGLLNVLGNVNLARSPFERSSALVAWEAVPLHVAPSRKAFLRKMHEFLLRVTFNCLVQIGNDAEAIHCEKRLRMLAKVSTKYDLDCHRLGFARTIDIDDKTYRTFVIRYIEEFDEDILSYLMQDPRWDPNVRVGDGIGAGGEEAAGQTVLHLAVEDGSSVMVNRLLESGSDHTIRDAKGRTPFLLSESLEMLDVFLSHNVDVRARDGEGRNIWHFAAANNDMPMIQALISTIDPDSRQAALKETTNAGRTPLAEAFDYKVSVNQVAFSEAERGRRYKSRLDTKVLSSLLEYCHGDPEYLVCDKPLINLAASWGDAEIVEKLATCRGIDVHALDESGSTAMHLLSLRAPVPLVRALRKVCCKDDSFPLQNEEGQTPFETVFGFIWMLKRPADEWDNDKTDTIFKRLRLLLFDGTLDTRDSQGRGIWERFCDHVRGLGLYPTEDLFDHKQVWCSVGAAFDILIEIGALAQYEEEKKTSGLLIFLRATHRYEDGLHSPMVRPYTKVIRMTKYFDENRTDPTIAMLLRCLIKLSHEFTPEVSGLLDALLANRPPLHVMVDGRSAIGEAISASRCAPPLFARLLKLMTPAELDLPAYNEIWPPLHSLCWVQDSRWFTYRDSLVQMLIDHGATIDVVTMRLTPCLAAAIAGNSKCTLMLLRAGADMTFKEEMGMDVTLAAARRNDLDVLKLVKELAGPDFNWAVTATVTAGGLAPPWLPPPYKDCNGLHIASYFGSMRAMAFYLENGLLDVNAKSGHFDSQAIHFAATGGSVLGIEMLLKHGADVNARDSDGLTPLHKAVGSLGCLNKLFDMGCDKDPKDYHGVTPLMRSMTLPKSYNENLKAIMARLANEPGWKPKPPYSIKATQVLAKVMERAVNRSDEEVCLALLNLGCRVDVLIPSCGHCTPLMLALFKSDPKMVELLLSKGAKKFTGNCPAGGHLGLTTPKSGFSAVMAVFTRVNPACLTQTLDACLRLDYNWFSGSSTPVHIAAVNGHVEAMEAIIEHVKAHEEEYRKWLPAGTVLEPSCAEPISSASSSDDKATGTFPILRWLVNKREVGYPRSSRWSRTPLHTALGPKKPAGLISALKLLLAAGADPNAVDERLRLPIHIAIAKEQFDAVPILLEHGATHSQPDASGYTPLMRACLAGHLPTVKTLIAAGSDPHQLAPDDRSTLLHLACEHKPDLFHYLRTEVGLDPYARDHDGWTPWLMALREPPYHAYAINSEIDLPRAMGGRHPAADMFDFDGYIDAENYGERRRLILPRVLRRWPRSELPARLNDRPSGEPWATPLYCAALWGYAEDLRRLVEVGAGLEVEGGDEGTAMMIAAKCGRLEAVRVLVDLGARVAYVDDEGRVKDAVGLSEAFPVVRDFLLVGRYTERKRIGAVSCAEELDGEAQLWTGVMEIPVAFTGTAWDYGRGIGETGLEFLKRMATVKRSMRGRVVVPYAGPWGGLPAGHTVGL